MLRYLTSGESHGQALLAILDGLPAGVRVDEPFVQSELRRRQVGYGRGDRMKIETDRAEFLSGVRRGETIGSPISVRIRNKDWSIEKLPRVTQPRPGHADLAGILKYGRTDVRDILERASARETAARVAVGALAKLFLRAFSIEVWSHVVEIGGVRADAAPLSFEDLRKAAEASSLRCADPRAEKEMKSRIDWAANEGDTLGGIFEVVATGVPPGLGDHIQWDRRLDGRLASALMSIPAIKGVEIGMGFVVARLPGSKVHDEIVPGKGGAPFLRPSNNAGGIEGGISNGQEIISRCAMKPLSSLQKPMRSVDIESGKSVEATVERSDVCAVPAAGVVGEAALAFELAKALLEKFGGDSLQETERNCQGYLKQLRKKGMRE